mmetsp:Transcript_90968/g.208359  ORF Transcript_90968/g.208359 Transcript_90968/m.208359 type:complete len:202 (-) Transcript_90968:82-687(-)
MCPHEGLQVRDGSAVVRVLVVKLTDGRKGRLATSLAKKSHKILCHRFFSDSRHFDLRGALVEEHLVAFRIVAGTDVIPMGLHKLQNIRDGPVVLWESGVKGIDRPDGKSTTFRPKELQEIGHQFAVAAAIPILCICRGTLLPASPCGDHRSTRLCELKEMLKSLDKFLQLAHDALRLRVVLVEFTQLSPADQPPLAVDEVP